MASVFRRVDGKIVEEELDPEVFDPFGEPWEKVAAGVGNYLGREVTAEEVKAWTAKEAAWVAESEKVPCPIRRLMPDPVLAPLRKLVDPGGTILADPHFAWWHPEQKTLRCRWCDFQGKAPDIRLAIVEQMAAFEAAADGGLTQPVDEQDLRPMRLIVAELVRCRVRLDVAMVLADAYDQSLTISIGSAAIERLFRLEVENT